MERYIKAKTGSNRVSWRFNNKCQTIPAGKALRLELLAMATVHWSVDNWQSVNDTPTHATGLDVFIADLPVEKLPAGTTLVFTFHWSDSDSWEGTNFEVSIV